MSSSIKKTVYKKFDLNRPGKIIKPFWNTCVGAGRANEGLRADWQEQLKMSVKECGFRYIRFHGLLCDDMGIYKVIDGVEHYNYQYVDSLFDFLLSIRIRPFVEFGFMPGDMASGEATQFWWKGNITPPASYEAWGRLLKNLVLHWIERYGKEEVLTWYFEIWNEADLNAFWKGTKSQYFELYKVSVREIKSVDEKLRVGGPATSNFVPDERFDGETEDFTKHKTHLAEELESLSWKGVWIEDFLKYCESNQLPVDFVSTHPYPTDFALDVQDAPKGTGPMKGRSRYAGSTKDDILWIREILEKSAYPQAELHLTEWSSSPTSRDYSHDYLPAASYIIKTNLDCMGLTNSLSYWVFTDIFEETGVGPEAFHGGFGMLNLQGIKKPAFHAYRLLNSIGNTELEKGSDYIVTKNEAGRLRALYYYYPEELTSTVPIAEYPNHEKAEAIQALGTSKEITLEFTGLLGQFLHLELLDDSNGNVTSLWKEMGHPANLTPAQTKELKAYSDNFKKWDIKVEANGSAALSLSLKPWSILYISE